MPTLADRTPAERVTDLARNAAQLLRINGFAWGPSIAVGAQLTFDGALARAASHPGDAFIVEREYLRRLELDEIARGGPVLPDAFAPGAVDARIDYLARLEVTDAHLRDHFGTAWEKVLVLNARIVSVPSGIWLERVPLLGPVKNERRNRAWIMVRDHAREQGTYRHWRAALEVIKRWRSTGKCFMVTQRRLS